MVQKPGLTSSEFILSIVGVVGGVVLGAISETPITQMIGAILAAVCGASYNVGRSLVKSNEAKGAAVVQASHIASAAAKKNSDQ